MVSLKKQLALRKILSKKRGGVKKKKKEKRALIEILFCKHIKSCQLLNILNAHKNVHRWASFLFTLVKGKKSFIIKLKVLEFFKLNCASIS